MKLKIPFIGGGKSKGAGGQKERYRIVSLDRKKARAGWLFVLPFVIGFLLIYLPIIWQSILYSFGKINYLADGGIIRENVMFDNYVEALSNGEFLNTLWSGMKQLALEIPAILFFSLFIAILLNQKMVGRAAFRAIFFIPVILATGLISGIDASTQNAATAANQIATGSGVSSIISTDDIKGLFSKLTDAEVADLKADGYSEVKWGSVLVDNYDEYYTYLFYQFDYNKAPIYLFPFTPNTMATGGFTNGYGFTNE